MMEPKMKNLVIVTSAAMIGGIIGSLTLAYLPHTEAASSETQTKALVLLDENNQPAARLGFVNGNTVLQFYNRDSTVALEIGVERKGRERFLHFFGQAGRSLASLNSLQTGDTTLYLGDRLGTRVTLGALLSDVATDKPTGEWGLVFPKPRSTALLFDLRVHSSQELQRSSAGIQLIRQNGEEWSVY
jgi:hypothetical protein